MKQRSEFAFILLVAILFIQCKREPMQIHPKITHLSDYESNDGSISLGLTGGKAPYTIQWSNADSDTIISGLSAGLYFVTITDAKKNILFDTITINQPEWPVCIDADGNSYKTSVVGSTIWMIENLRVSSIGEKAVENYVYDNNEENAAVYGRLYTWNSAMNDSIVEGAQGICPDGWHIPSEGEWSTLIDNISTVDKEIPNIKSALNLAYAGFYNNSFNNLDASVSFWTSTEANDNAMKLYFHKSLSKAFSYHEKKSNAISVRCVKNQ